MSVTTLWMWYQYFFALFQTPKQGKNYMGAQGDVAPKMPKRALENVKRAPENSHRHKVNGGNMSRCVYNVAPEIKLLLSPCIVPDESLKAVLLFPDILVLKYLSSCVELNLSFIV